MYMNLDTLPTGQGMFTAYLREPGKELVEELDFVAGSSLLRDALVEAARAAALPLHGSDVEVLAIVDQVLGEPAYISPAGLRLL